jgi:ABC-type uncharacterized transport system permease subunit
MMSILMHAPVAGAYLALVVWAWRGAARTRTLSEQPESAASGGVTRQALSHELPAIERLLLLFVWLGHGMLLFLSMFRPDGLQFGFALALSATMWLAVAVYWVESLYFNLASMRLLVLPLAAFYVILPVWFPGSLAAVPPGNHAFQLHLLVAMSAYGLLTIAALHALLMAALDRWLHGRDAMAIGPGSRRTGWAGLQQVVLGQLPSLMTMERLLFRTLFAGFVLLSLTVLSGLVFSEELFGRAFRLEHKTVFGLIAWLIFGALLMGRKVYGWRGRVALRWTLAGFTSLLLAYVGSRFVLEVILQRI